jgi:hypothetical protein
MISSTMSRRRLEWNRIVLSMCVASWLIVTTAHAQVANYAETGLPEVAGLEIIQDEPHDLVFFKAAAGGGWAKVRLLDFPGRTPNPKKDGTLRMDVLGIETQSFAAKWDDIERIDFWEVRLEREATERIKAGDFTGAYPFLAVLIRDFPNRPGLRELRCEYLFGDARKRAAENNFGATVAILEELRDYAPEYKSETVLKVLGFFTDQLIGGLVKEQRFSLAQQVLARLERDFKSSPLSSVAKWNQEFLKMATEKQKLAVAARDKKDFFSARKLSRESVFLTPTIPGGKELIAEIDQIYPLVNVGVLQAASEYDPIRLDNWAARRSGRLLYRTLFEMRGAGAEGGEYDFIFGDIAMSPDRLQFDMVIKPEKIQSPLQPIPSFFLADKLAKRASQGNPEYFAPWAAAVYAIGLEGPLGVRCVLRRPHVLPNCLVQMPVDASWFGGEPGGPTGDYARLDGATPSESRFQLRSAPRTETQPREIVEVHVKSAAEAMQQLLKGEMDVMDQLFPADAARLKENRAIRVGTYPLPTVHMLIPTSDHAFLAQRTFRRALDYGTNKQDILKGELLEKKELAGCQVVSGPFPAGIEPNDPLGYAYDRSIEPRRYEPRLAKLLLTMNENQMKSEFERKKEPVPELKPIRLAHPPDNLSRVACQAIKSQWELLGLKVELIELPIGQTQPEEGKADLVYVSAAVWEPILDARRVLGPEGLAKSKDQLVGLGLRRLEEAKNWREVREALLDLHSIAHHELPVIPLWQLVESYAYRRELQGVGNDIISLYQNLEKWRLTR